MANSLLLPNIVGQYNQGYQLGQEQKFNDLAGQAINASPDQRSNLLALAGRVDPISAVRIGSYLQDQDAERLKTQQMQQGALMQRVNGAARFMLDAVNSKDPARIQGAYQTVRPFLAQLGQQHGNGQQPPESFSEDMLPAIYQLAGQSGGLNNEGVVVSAGGALVDKTTGRPLFNNPAKPAKPILTSVPDGSGGSIQAIFDPNTRQFIHPNYGPATSAGSMDAINARISNEVNSGRMTPEQGDAAIAKAYQDAGFNVGGTPSGGLGYTPPKKSQEGKSYRQLTADEVAQLGLPKGTVAQQDSDGKIDIVNKPSQQDAKLQMQARQAKAGLAGTTAQLDRLRQAAVELKNDPGLSGITGITGRFPNAPGSDATRAEAKLNTLRSQIGFGVLQNMREMSKTGGALGSVSDKENELLQNNLAALDPKQSREDFIKSLDKVIQYVDDSKARLQGAYNTAYGDVSGEQEGAYQPPQAPASAPSKAASVDDLLSKYGVH
jgi:hypothetical protein